MDGAEVGPTWSLAASLWLALVVAFGIVNHAAYFEVPVMETADSAANGIKIENARHFAEIYGNYSRFAFNHPGPAFYYVYALGEVVLCDLLGTAPAPGNAHLATGMALQSAFFALAIAMFASWWRWRVWLPLALLGAALQFGTVHSAFVSTWPPDVLLMPSLAFLVACISVACGRLDHLIVLVITGGFLFHGHVAQTIFVGCLGPLALVLNLGHHRRTEGSWALRKWFSTHRAGWTASAALVVLFLLPLVIDVVLHGSRGNVATILARFGANSDDGKNPVQSLLYFLSFATQTEDQDILFTTIGPATHAFFAAHAARFVAWGVIALGPPLAVLLWRRRFTRPELRFLGTAWLVLAGTVVLCVVWGMAQARQMFHFNGVFYYGVFVLALLLALAVLSKAIDRWYQPTLAITIVTSAAVMLAWDLHMPPPPVGPGSVMQIRVAVDEAVAATPVSAPRLLVFEHDDWPIATAVALELHRRSSGFRVVPWWGFMFGAEQECAYPDLLAGRPAAWWVAPSGPDGIPLTPELSLFTGPASIRPEHDEIRFWKRGRGFRYQVTGLTVSNVEFAWTNLPRALFWFKTPPTRHDVRIVFDAMTAVVEGDMTVPQAAEVSFNGVALGRLVVGARTEVEVRVPAAEWNRAPDALLELHFPGAARRSGVGRPGYDQWDAWGLHAIKFQAGPVAERSLCDDFDCFGPEVNPSGLETAGNWSLNGWHPSAPAPPLQTVALGSWSGADSCTGVSRVWIPSRTDDAVLLLPLLTGPDASAVFLRIYDPRTGATQASLQTPSPFPDRWRLWRVPLPARTDGVPWVLEVEDRGEGWGQWLAFAVPHWELAAPAPR